MPQCLKILDMCIEIICNPKKDLNSQSVIDFK